MLLLCFGTRPEWLKIKPIVNLLKEGQYKLLFTGQHIDLLKDTKAHYSIDITNKTDRLDDLVSSCLLQFPKEKFTGVLVQGDTASAFACAVAAFHRNIKIYYLEAGLRSYNLQHPYPEEGYRQMIARLADVSFAPTKLSYENLRNEKVQSKIYITGNTALDNLVEYKSHCEYTNKVLITLHRRENHHWIDKWFQVIDNLAKKHPDLEFILPIHPNPNIQKYKKTLKHVNIIEPLEHKDLLNLLVKCRLVITDSGGLQEEGSFFNKKVIVCRTVTERPEAIKTGHLFICKTPTKLNSLFIKINKKFKIKARCPYGDGNSAQKIVKHLYG